MTLLVLMACLAMQHFYTGEPLLSRSQILQSYMERCLSYAQRYSPTHGWAAWCICILPAGLVADILYEILLGPAFNLLAFIFSAALLLFCLHTLPTDEQLHAYQEAMKAERYDDAAAQAESCFGHPFEPTAHALQLAVRQAMLKDALRYVFTVIFWYTVLGPSGALLPPLLFALQAQLKNATVDHADGLSQATEKSIHWLSWPVVRLLGMAMALVGHFRKAFAYWIQHVRHNDDNDVFLDHITTAAMADHGDTEHASHTNPLVLADLLSHALVLWVVGIALVQVGGWLL